MDGRKRACPEQFLMMIKFMERNGDLNRQLSGLGRLRAELLWRELTHALNGTSGGVKKPVIKWKRVWADWKSKTKKKATGLRGGGGRSAQSRLTALEHRVLALMAQSAVKQAPAASCDGITREQELMIKSVVERGLEHPEAVLSERATSGGLVIARGSAEASDGVTAAEASDGVSAAADGCLPSNLEGTCVNVVIEGERLLPPYGTDPPASVWPVPGPGPADPRAAGLPADLLPATRESPLLLMSSDGEDSQDQETPGKPPAPGPSPGPSRGPSPGPNTPKSSPPSAPSSPRARSFAANEVRRLRLERLKEMYHHEREMQRLRAEASRDEYLRSLVELARSLLAALVAKVDQY